MQKVNHTKDRVIPDVIQGGYFGLAALVLASRDPLSSNALLLASVFLLVEKKLCNLSSDLFKVHSCFITFFHNSYTKNQTQISLPANF